MLNCLEDVDPALKYFEDVLYCFVLDPALKYLEDVEQCSYFMLDAVARLHSAQLEPEARLGAHYSSPCRAMRGGLAWGSLLSASCLSGT